MATIRRYYILQHNIDYNTSIIKGMYITALCLRFEDKIPIATTGYLSFKAKIILSRAYSCVPKIITYYKYTRACALDHGLYAPVPVPASSIPDINTCTIPVLYLLAASIFQ